MKSKSLVLFFAAAFLFFNISAQNAKQSLPGDMRAGTAKIDITPEIPVMLYGYASRKSPSEGVHDHLYARAVAFENNGQKILLISSDLGSYTDTLASVISKAIMEKFNLKESEIFLAAIHSHSSPV